MNRVDIEATEADFIEFTFDNGAVASAAERCFPVDFVRSGEKTIEYRAGVHIDGIRDELTRRGLTWSESESGLTEDDMWPEWPGDEEASFIP